MKALAEHRGRLLSVDRGSLKDLVRRCLEKHYPLEKIARNVLLWYTVNSDRSSSKTALKQEDPLLYAEQRAKKIIHDLLKEPHVVADLGGYLSTGEYQNIYG